MFHPGRGDWLGEQMIEREPRISYRKRVYDSYISKRPRLTTAYDEETYRRWAAAALVRFKDWLPADPTAPILDLGCGLGNCLYLFEQIGYSNLIGVDMGAEQLALAAKAAPNAKLIQDDLVNFLSDCSSQYELVICLNVIEHFRKEELFRFLDLAVDVLKPGGRIIFETPNAASPWFGAVAYADFTHEWFFTPRGLYDLLTLMGLEGYEARPSEPVRSGLRNWGRCFIWQFIHKVLTVWNLAETGSAGSQIYTRVFVATAIKTG